MRDEPMVREAMQSVEQALAAAPGGDALDRLRTSWTRLVDVLALGPAPALRTCPNCGATGMREATRCGTCWSKLVPPGAEGDPT
ncbi:MAG: hypothetical protein HZB56_22945 [Deltaproteobacteria bacterium]|nr:hypothetical protein [Deltaproteobacteria bacterium]